jgi:hypothetical protein
MVPPGGISLGLAFNVAISPDDRYVSYAEINPKDQGGTTDFSVGNIMVLDVAANTKRVVGDGHPQRCILMQFQNCAPITFSKTGGDIALRTDTEKKVYDLLNLKDGTSKPLSVPPGEELLWYTPDLSGFVTAVQMPGGGAVHYLDAATNTTTPLATTTASFDLHANTQTVDVALLNGKAYVAIAAPTASGTPLQVWEFPGGKKTDFGDFPISTRVQIIGDRVLLHHFNIVNQKMVGAVSSFPLSGGPSVELTSNADGSWFAPSPTGTRVLLYGAAPGDMSKFKVIGADGSNPQEIPAGDMANGPSAAWADESTIYYTAGPQYDLRRWHIGDATSTLVTTNIDQAMPRKGGVAAVERQPMQAQFQVINLFGSAYGKEFVQPVPLSMLTEGHMIPDSGDRTSLGRGNGAFWVLGRGLVSRTFFYFDPFNQYQPSPMNGTVVFQP